MLQRLLLLKLLLLGLILSQYSGTQYAAAHSHTNTSGVYLMYEGEILPNNSAIVYDVDSNVSVYCVTDFRPCCADPGQGEWHYSLNGGPVSSERISRYNNGTIILHIILLSYSIGLHHCRLPNAANITQYIYVGLYYRSPYELNFYWPRIERMVYNTSSHTLTCISRGSPATTVIWRKNGVVINTDRDVYEREQMLTRPFNYHNQLIIIDSALSIAGVTCQISNTIGLSQIYPIIESGITLSVSTAQDDQEIIHKFNNNTDLQRHFSGLAVSGRIIYRTSYNDCCGNNHSHTGQCFFPHGKRIENTSSDSEVYVSRSEQTVELHFRNITNMDGIYHCTVANQQGQDQDCHFTLQTDTITENNFSIQIFYNSTDSSLQCKFQGHAYEVQWYLISAYIDPYYRYVRTYDSAFPLDLGNQYHQSTIQATNLENGYTNELTIVSGFALFGVYRCAAVTGNSHHYSDDISTYLGFSYENRSYKNNSVILIHHRNNFIYHDQPAISCLTDNSNFYSQTNGYSDSTWYDPMGGRVSDLYVYSYHFSLLQQQCFVQYNHSQYSYSITLPRLVYTLGESYYTGSESCSGLYRCLIPDRHGELQQLFLGIYSDTGSNIPSPTISSFYISQAPEHSLICISKNSAATEVIWKRNGVPIIIDGIVFDSSQTVIDTQHSTYENKLVFLTSTGPPGLCTCMVTNDFGSATSDYGINIGDPEPAKIIHTQDIYFTAVINSTFTVSCHGYGNELPAILWNKYEEQLSNDSRIVINQRYVSQNSTYQFTTSTLIISDIETEDAGSYSCIANNSNGTDVHHFILKVLVPAQFSSVPSNAAVDLCTNITLTCEGYGIPAPTITWDHDGVTLSMAIVDHTESNGTTYVSSSISITTIGYQDRGQYMCSIQNDIGRDTANFNLSVNYEAAEITSLTADQMVVNESDSIRISCEARGSPPLVITWQREIGPNNIVRLSEDTHVHSTSTDETMSCNVSVQQSVIEISSSRAEDGVEYICQAQNDHPNIVASKRLRIAVQILDECTSSPCQNGGVCVDEYLAFSCNCVGTNHTGNQCQEPGVSLEALPSPNISNITASSITQAQLVSPVNLTCEATGAPPLTYRWYRDGQLLEGKIRPYLYIAEFSPEDRGNYTCNVINNEGMDESDGALLTIKGVRQYRILITESESESTSSMLSNINEQTISEIRALLLRNNSLHINGEVYGLITENETLSNSAAIIVTVYTSENYSSNRIWKALTQVLQSAYSSLTFDIERYDGCHAEDDVILEWPETEIGDSITLPCPCQDLIGNPANLNRPINITRRCEGSYSMGAHWEEVGYQTQCNLTNIAIELCTANIISAKNNPEQLAESLVDITNRSEEIQAVGISIATTLIEGLTDDAIENEEIRENYLTTIDNLIQADKEEVAKSQTVGAAPMRLLLSLADFTDRVNLSNTSTILTRESYAIIIEEIDTDSFIGETLTVDLGSVDDALKLENNIDESALNKEAGTNSSFQGGFTATVQVPQSIFNDDKLNLDKKQRLSYSVFVRGSLFLNQNASQQSIIVGVRVNGTDMLQNPITVYLHRQESISNSSGNLTCGRWNITMHEWSTRDCQIRNFAGLEVEDKQRTRIMENDTTPEGPQPAVYETKFYQPGYFGLILDLTYGIVDPLPYQFTFTLEIISYICLVSSLACLTFLMITYICTKQLRNNYHGQILINMSVSLALLYLTFLIGAHAAPVPALCGISAALLQYFLLVFFGWTAVEAVYLYRNLVQVLVSQIARFVLKAGLIVWILPMLIVVLSAGPGYRDYHINDRSFCRSKGLPFWLGLVLPFLILNVFNWCVFIMIMVSLIKRSVNFKEKADFKDKLKSAKKQVAIATGLATLFGLGWGFGLAASGTTINELTFTFQLLFSLFVGLQGVILFVLHGVRKPEARGQWKVWLTKVSSKSMQLYSIAKSASTATDSRMEMSTLQRGEKKDWGSVPTLDVIDESKSMIGASEKPEKEDLSAAQVSTMSDKEPTGTAHGLF